MVTEGTYCGNGGDTSDKEDILAQKQYLNPEQEIEKADILSTRI